MIFTWILLLVLLVTFVRVVLDRPKTDYIGRGLIVIFICCFIAVNSLLIVSTNGQLVVSKDDINDILAFAFIFNILPIALWFSGFVTYNGTQAFIIIGISCYIIMGIMGYKEFGFPI